MAAMPERTENWTERAKSFARTLVERWPDRAPKTERAWQRWARRHNGIVK